MELRNCPKPTASDLSMLASLELRLDGRFCDRCRALAAEFSAELRSSIDVARLPGLFAFDLSAISSIDQLESVRRDVNEKRFAGMLACVRIAEQRLEVLAELDEIIHHLIVDARRRLRGMLGTATAELVNGGTSKAEAVQAVQCRPDVQNVLTEISELRELSGALRTCGNADPESIALWLNDVGTRLHAWMSHIVDPS